MAKYYRIETHTNGLDLCIVGPGVYEVIPPEQSPEAERYLDLFDRVLAAALSALSFRAQDFVTDLVNCTRLTPGIVNHGEVVRLVREHLPEYDHLLFPHRGAPSPGEGTHGAGSERTNEPS